MLGVVFIMAKLLRQKYYDKYTKDELVELIKIEKESKKSTELAHAITMKIEDERKANGTYVFCGGYSGRQTKRGVG